MAADKSDKRPTDQDVRNQAEETNGAAASPAEADRPADEQDGQPQRIEFRRTFLDSSEPAEPAQQPRSPAGDLFFVTVNSNGANETHCFDDAAGAASFVADLLEQGMPQESVAAFSGRRVGLKVSRRPVVQLGVSG